MAVEEKQNWFSKQTQTVKKLTVWLSFFAILVTVIGICEVQGVHLLDFTIGCSSFSSQTEQNTKDIQKIFIQDSVNDFWKGIRHLRDSTSYDKRFNRIEKKLHISNE